MIAKPKKRGGNVPSEISPLQHRILDVFKARPNQGFLTAEIADAVGESGNRNITNTLGILKMNLTILRLPGRIQKAVGAHNKATWTYQP